MYANNIQGPGQPSPTRVVDVGMAIPSRLPQNFKAVVVSPTEVNVTWTPPSKGDLNRNLLGYKLFMWEDEKNELINNNYRRKIDSMRIIGYTHAQLLLTNLTEYSTYHFRMLAYNSAGDGKNLHIPFPRRRCRICPRRRRRCLSPIWRWVPCASIGARRPRKTASFSAMKSFTKTRCREMASVKRCRR